MALLTDVVSSVKQAINAANEIYVLFPETQSVDVVAAALALAEGIQKSGKIVHVASPAALVDTLQSLLGIDQVSEKIGNRNLVISLKVGSRDSIDKVSYNLEEDGSTFNLIIQPKKGQVPLKSEDVSFSYSGAAADLVIMVGANRFEDFGRFYEDEKKLFTEGTSVSIHRYHAVKYATYQLDDTRAGSLSEIMVSLMKQLDYPQSKDSATNLLSGIDTATNRLLAPTVTADTFDAVAQLLRAGGIRQGYGEKVTPTEVKVAPAPVPSDWLQPKIYKSSDASKV